MGTGTDIKLQAGDSVDLFRFDFTDATLPIASGSLAVTLWTTNTSGPVTATLTAYVLELANDGWGEGRSSWNNQVQSGPTPWASATSFGNPPTGNAGLAGSAVGTFTSGSEYTVTIPLDVPLLNGMRTGAYSRSIALFSGSNRELRVYSSEAFASEKRPYLDVTLTAPPAVVPEPVTFVTCGLAIAGLGRYVRRRTAVQA